MLSIIDVKQLTKAFKETIAVDNLSFSVPKGEVYHAVEGGNGELGFYLVSDGGRSPLRLHFRRPCFIYYQAYPEMIRGAMLSDAVLVMSSMNVIAGELDA